MSYEGARVPRIPAFLLPTEGLYFDSCSEALHRRLLSQARKPGAQLLPPPRLPGGFRPRSLRPGIAPALRGCRRDGAHTRRTAGLSRPDRRRPSASRCARASPSTSRTGATPNGVKYAPSQIQSDSLPRYCFFPRPWSISFKAGEIPQHKGTPWNTL